MTTADHKLPATNDTLHLSIEKDTRLDRWIDYSCRWLNPILIKESRQSIKSYQFVVTFTLVLFAAVFWSFLGLALMPGLAYNEGGAVFLAGFNWILLFPLMVIVPVWTFWSQVSEQEENSLELVTLSTMRPAQIVSGKFVTALLQVLVYLSVLAPCICFTYLLRGIGIAHISFSITIVVLSGVALICFSLFLATSAHARATQIIFLIGLVLGCFFCFAMVGGMTATAISESAGFVDDLMVGEDGEFLGFLGYCWLLITYSIVTLCAAISNITFPTDNRATRIRLALLFQQAIFVGWAAITYRWVGEPFLIIMIIFAAVHWGIVGLLLIGETAEMSQRVRRSLPKTLIGQLLCSWLMPGPQRGFFFMISCLWSIALAFGILVTYEHFFSDGSLIRNFMLNDYETTITHFYYTCGYPTIYVGMTAIIAYFLRKLFKFSFPILTLIIGGALAFALMFFPWILVASIGIYDPTEIPFLISPSWPLVSTGILNESIIWYDASVMAPFTMTLLLVLIANLLIVAKELGYRREQAPERVQQEIAEENPVTEELDIDIFAEES